MFSSVIHNNRDILDNERMSYLESLVIGSAKEAISGYLCNPGFYHEALSELERLFGNPQHVVSALTKELELWQRPQASDHATLISYAYFPRKLVQTLNAHGFYADLKSTYLLWIARDKLPWSLKIKWSEHLVDINITFPGLVDLSNWMHRQARACEQLQDSVSLQNQSNDNGKQPNFNRRDNNNHQNANNNHQPIFSNRNKNNNKRFGNRKMSTNGSFRNGGEPVNNYSHNNVRRDNIGGKSQLMNNSRSTTSNNNRISEINSSNTQQTKSKKCPVDQGDHYIGKCSKFLQMSPSERNSEVKKNLLCYNCLSPNHNAKNCPSKVLCRHCSRKHHSMLHDKNYSPNQKTNITQQELPLCESFEDITSGTKPPSYTPLFPRRVRNQLPMIPIKLFGRNEHFECYALLDSCSTISYAFDPMVTILNAPPTSSETTLNVSTAFGDSSMEAKLVQLDIWLFRSQRPLLRLNYVYSIKNWHFDDAPLTQLNEVCSKYPHLQLINFPKLENNKIQVLLGIDATQYILEREFLQGPKNTPFAIRCLLGWTITGPIKFDNDKTEKTNFLSDSFEAFDREMTFSTGGDEDPLTESFTSFWKIDTSVTENEDENSLSENDQRAVEILNNRVRHTGERYESSLLWREKVSLENNYPVAKAQVQSLDKKLKKDKALKDMYQKTLDTDIEKGYVKSVTFSDTTPDRVWYLPHHPVTNPIKPGKVRRVSNAASTFKGNSLNSNLLTGPDLLNNLVRLLLRFRENSIAITADIEAMFMQVGIIETFQPSMRFLWPTERSIKQFQYTRLIFGARCSPTTAIYVLQKTASVFSPNRAVKDLVYNSFYMDDFVHSFETIQKAKENAVLLKKTPSKGGFNLTKFVSNEQSAIQDFDDSKKTKIVIVYSDFTGISLLTDYSTKKHQSLTTTVTAIQSGNFCR